MEEYQTPELGNQQKLDKVDDSFCPIHDDLSDHYKSMSQQIKNISNVKTMIDLKAEINNIFDNIKNFKKNH